MIKKHVDILAVAALLLGILICSEVRQSMLDSHDESPKACACRANFRQST